MHKFILSTLLLTSLSFAQKSYSFFGAETSWLYYNSSTSPSIGLKYGIQRDMWRTSFTLDYASNSSDSLSSLLVQVDKGILKNITKESPFKPYVGFSFGLLQHHGSSTNSGYGYGVNTGVTYLLNDAVDLDLSYRYLSTSKINAFNSLNGLSLSLHYFY